MKMTFELCARASALWVLALSGIAQAAPAAEAAPVVIAGTGGSAGFGGAGGGVAPPISAVRLVNHGAGIPVNGALLIFTGGSTGSPPIVEVADNATPGTTLGGTLTVFMASEYWVWIPSTPFVEGTIYQVRLSAPELGIVGNPDTFEAKAAITIARPPVLTAPSASWRSETSGMAFCKSLFGGALSETTMFPSEQRASVVLDPGFSTTQNAVFMNQFMFRMTTGDNVSTTPLMLWPNVFVSPIYEQAEEYCFKLEAVDIVSGMTFAYDDLEACAPHGDLADLGTTAIEPGAAELDRLVCHAPPDQFKDQWCELNEDPCKEDRDATACGLYGYVCEGEPLPPDPFGGTSGIGGMAGFGGMFAGVGGFGGTGAGAIGGSTSGGQGGASGMSEVTGGDGSGETKSSGGSDGCSATPARADHSSALGLAFGAAALALVSRRRKPRR